MVRNMAFYLKKTILFFLLYLAVLAPITAQGWDRAWWLSSTGVDTAKNDIIDIAEYVDGVNRALAFISVYENTALSYFTVNGENAVGFATDQLIPNNISLTPRSIVSLSRDTFCALADWVNTSTGNQDLYFFKRYHNVDSSSFYEKIWTKPVFEDPDYDISGASIIRSSDNHILSYGAIHSEIAPMGLVRELILVKSNTDGEHIWSKTMESPGDDIPIELINAPDGGFWLLKNVREDQVPSGESVWLIKTDAEGIIEGEINVGEVGDRAAAFIMTHDGHLAITGENSMEQLFVLKVDIDGNQIWRQDYNVPDRTIIGNGITEDLQHSLIVAGKSTWTSTGKGSAYIAKLSESGNPLWEKMYREDRSNYTDIAFNDIVLTPEGNYYMAGYIDADFPGSLSYQAKTDTFGIIKGGTIHGNVFQDFNIDCIYDSTELGLEDWVIKVESDTLVFFGNTNTQGDFWIPVHVLVDQPEEYTISVIKPNNYWEICNNDTLVIIGYLDTVQVNFPAQPLVDCPYLDVQIVNGLMRPCESTPFHIDYTNNGTALAADARIEVTLDDLLFYDSASITPVQINGQQLTFSLGNLEVNASGSLSIYTRVSCSANIDNELCIELNTFPDTICSPLDLEWSGALLEVNYTCENDSVQYEIKNIGTGSTEEDLNYIIIEDAVLLQQNSFNLDPGQSIQSETYALDGSTYHLIAQQEPGAPGPEWISVTATNCPNIETNLANQFAQNSGNPFNIFHCTTVVNSFDPNDKQANPSGFGEEHSILPNTDIQYTIRFQNIGTDTAFRVIILDTLAAELDPGTVVPGPSSHPYDWRIDENGLLRFSFHNIELPDSSTNVEASQGFVSFSIAQQRDLPVETRIENRAGIYFDFNPAVITNTYFHTVREFLDIVNESVVLAKPELEVIVMPNPLSTGASIQLSGSQTMEPLILHLYNSNGVQVRALQSEMNRFWLERGQLPSGFYFFSIEQNGLWQASGKMIIK